MDYIDIFTCQVNNVLLRKKGSRLWKGIDYIDTKKERVHLLRNNVGEWVNFEVLEPNKKEIDEILKKLNKEFEQIEKLLLA